MKAAFRLTLALIATFGASGCRTAGLSPSARPTPAVVPEPRLSFHLDEFIEDHNRNAERIESLTSSASISGTMVSPETGEPTTGGINGHVSFLRPKDFKFEVTYGFHSRKVADIGSNRDRFWFWLQSDNKDSRHVYFCDYADLPSANLAGTYQPDWIVEVLGLKPINPDEVAAVRISPGPKKGTTTLTFPASGKGSAYARAMVVSDETRRLAEYRLYDQDGKTLIGQASVKEYKNIELNEHADAESVEPSDCYIASHVLLEWKREELSLDIVLNDLTVNKTFTDRMKANFVEPKPRGYTPMDLAEATRNAPRTGGEMTAVRETLPPPERSQDRDRGWGRDRGRTAPPVEIQGAEPAIEPQPRRISTPASARSTPPARRVRPKPDDEAPAAALDPILLPVLDDVVGAVRPQPPGTPYRAADSTQLLGGGTFAR